MKMYSSKKCNCLRRRVLVVLAAAVDNGRRQVGGIRKYAAEHDWELFFTEGSPFGHSVGLPETLEHWRPDGLLLDPFYVHENASENLIIPVPTVVWDAESFPLPVMRCGQTRSDSAAIAKAAFSELMRGGPCQLAYVSAFGSSRWSVDRCKSFASMAKGAGIRFGAFAPPVSSDCGNGHFRRALSDFIASLTFPCGIMAANDATASMVYEACEANRLRVPEDVSIVGVDDNADYCEFLRPTLSSVRINVEEGGWRAAKLLEDMIAGRVTTGKVVRYGVDRVVRRASTSIGCVCDVRIKKALEYIRLNACMGINVKDVVLVMGCSRRTADHLFRTKLGLSVLDQIHDVRIERACELLSRGAVKIDNIPVACGYAKGPYLKLLFKKRMGCTMQEWRSMRIG